MNKRYDVFISYRRSSASEANLIAEKLRARGYRVFFDVEELRAGLFNEQLYRVIDKQAFQMALLFAAARNEQWLIEQGYLRNGELMLFTAPHPAWDYLLQQMAE